MDFRRHAIGFGFSVSFIGTCFAFRYSCFELPRPLDQLDFVAFLQSHDRLLPMRGPAVVLSALAFLLPVVIGRVHTDHLLLEKLFHRAFDLNLVSARADPKNILVMFFAQQRRLLGQRRSLDDVVRFVHESLAANCSRPFGVTRIFWNASNSSAFTSDALASFTGLTLRAERVVFSSNPSLISNTLVASV